MSIFDGNSDFQEKNKSRADEIKRMNEEVRKANGSVHSAAIGLGRPDYAGQFDTY